MKDSGEFLTMLETWSDCDCENVIVLLSIIGYCPFRLFFIAFLCHHETSVDRDVGSTASDVHFILTPVKSVSFSTKVS